LSPSGLDGDAFKRSNTHLNETDEKELIEKIDYVPEIIEEDKAMCSNMLLIPPLLFVVFAVQILYNLTDWWLNRWTNASERAEAARLSNSTIAEDHYSFFGLEFNVSLPDYMYFPRALTLASCRGIGFAEA
ncbi:hypothetical protein COOONC_16838, partial [Cooperia oncophora]